MAYEIERKFLPADDTWRDGAEGRYLCQAYLSLRPECVVRVRIDGEAAFLTLKGPNRGPERLEFEYAVPLEEAKAMIAAFAAAPPIEKTRHRLLFGGFIWEIDEFHGANQGLVVAEIELAEPDQEFSRPAWLGREVTDDARYYNSRLAERPYSLWGEDPEP